MYTNKIYISFYYLINFIFKNCINKVYFIYFYKNEYTTITKNIF